MSGIHEEAKTMETRQFGTVFTRLNMVALAAMALSLAACGGGKSQSPGGGGPTPTPTPSPTPALTPTPSTSLPSWDWILQSEGLPASPPAVTYLDVDGFDTDAGYVALARSRGVKTICYLNIGTAENNRPDYNSLAAISNLLGNIYAGYPSERYIDIRRYPEFIQIMDDRLRMCRDKGFDYVEFDVMDAFEDGQAASGFNLGKQDMVNYVTELSNRARAHGLKPVQKNTGDFSVLLEPLFDAVLFEECVHYGFCANAAPYVAAGKPALNAEYPATWPSGTFNRANVCATSATAHISTIITVVDLDRPAPDRCV